MFQIGEGGKIADRARAVTVEITDGGESIVTEVDGKAANVSLADYKVRLASDLLGEAPDLAAFVAQWIDPAARGEMLRHLPEDGTSAEKIRIVSQMDDYDLYDVLVCEGGEPGRSAI